MIKVTFDQNPSSITYKKILIFIENSGSLMSPLQENTKVDLAVSTSISEVFQQNEILFLEGFGSSGTFAFDAPLDSIDRIIKGTYTFDFKLYSDEVSSELEAVYELEVDDVCKNDELEISHDIDCYVGKLVVKDDTDYTGLTIADYRIEVSHPIISGETPIPVTSTTEKELVVDVPYDNVEYQISVSATKTVSTTQIISEQTVSVTFASVTLLSYNSKQAVQCNSDICGVISCVDSRIKELISQACAKGGLGNLSKSEQSRLELMNVYLSLYVHHQSCNNSESSKYYYDKLKELVGSDCNGCDTPKKLVKGSNVLYLQGDSAYQIWLDDGNEGTEQDFLDSLSVAPSEPSFISGSTSITGLNILEVKYRRGNSFLTFNGKYSVTDQYAFFDQWQSVIAGAIDSPYINFDQHFPVYDIATMEVVGKARHTLIGQDGIIQLYLFAAAQDKTIHCFFNIPKL